MKRTLPIICLVVMFFGALTALQAQTDNVAPPIAHERMPRPDGLFAGTSTDPVFIFEDSGPGTGLPKELVRDGVRIPAPNDGSSDVLMYRTAGSTPAAGTVQTVEHEVKPDNQTSREPWLNYHAVFDPALIPFKRNSAKDHTRPDGALVVADTSLKSIELLGNRARSGYEQFWGSVLVELKAGLTTPIPSVAPSSRILSVSTTPPVTLQFFKDGADNYFLSGGDYTGRVRVNFLMDAPKRWFSASLDKVGEFSDVPMALRPVLPKSFAGDVARVSRRIGIRSTDKYAVVLRKLVRWYRSFEAGEMSSMGGRSMYAQISLNKKGICRHRVYGFVITAHGLGIPARYVSNEAHVFAEVFLPGQRAGWLRIDLGGGAQGMTVHGAAQKTRHIANGDDPFGFPAGFQSGYSHRAAMGVGDDNGGDPVRGLPVNRLGGLPERVAGTGGAVNSRRASLRASTGRMKPTAADRRKIATTTALIQASAQVFRGEKLQLAGQVSAKGTGISGGEVRVVMLDSNGLQVVRVLGHARTDASGHFETSVVVPDDTAVGTWEIAAEFMGDTRHAPSSSK